MITATIKYTNGINSRITPIEVVESSVSQTNRINSRITPIEVVESSVSQTGRINSVLVPKTISIEIYTLLLTDISDFLISDGSKLKVQTQ